MAVLSHSADAEAQNIINTFTFAGGDNGPKITCVMSAEILDLLRTEENTVFERGKFWQRNQRKVETFDQ